MVDNKKIYLEETTAEKDIRVVFDPNLIFRQHMEEICKKTNRIMGVIRRTYSYLTEQVQRRATKQVPGLRDMGYSDRLKHLKLPTLVFRRIRRDMIEIYKKINVYDPKVAFQLIQLNKNKSFRGHSIKIRRDHANRDIRRNYLMQRAATM